MAGDKGPRGTLRAARKGGRGKGKGWTYGDRAGRDRMGAGTRGPGDPVIGILVE